MIETSCFGVHGDIGGGYSDITEHHLYPVMKTKLLTTQEQFDDFERRILPSPYYSIPTDEERLIGEYRRYFAKKNNELIYIEISKETYTKFKSNDPESSSDLYECLYLPWNLGYLSGETNKNIVTIVEKNNKWYGFTSYFQGNFG